MWFYNTYKQVSTNAERTMKQLTILYLTTIFLLLEQVCIGQTARLTGHLIVNNKDDIKNIADRTMIMLRVNNYQRIAVVDKDLNFSFDSLKTDTSEIRVTTTFYYQDTTIKNVVLKDNETTHIEIQYPPFCIYDKTKKDMTCPICSKQGEVIPIVYGLIVNTRRKSKKRQQEFKAGGCVVSGCDPNWYCKRDDKEF